MILVWIYLNRDSVMLGKIIDVNKKRFEDVAFYSLGYSDYKYGMNKDEGLYFVREDWNDYGFKTLYNVYAVFDGAEYDLGYFNATFYPYDEECNFIDFRNLKAGLIQRRIYSLGGKSYYEFFNKLFSQEDRVKYFNLMGDLAYDTKTLERIYNKPEKLHKKYGPTKSEGGDVIKHSFFRTRTYFEVLTQYSRIAKGEGTYQEPYNVIINESNGDEIISLDVNLSSLKPTSLYAIIGNNGAGKTKLLTKIVNSLLFQKTNDDNYIDETDYIIGTGLNEFNSLVLISYSPFDNNFPKVNEKNKKFYSFVTINFKERDYLSNEISSNIKDMFEGVSKLHKDKFKQIIQKLRFDPWFNMLEERIEDMELDLEDINKFSSGQKIILLNLLNLMLKVSERTLVIIDEPELFLHPPLLKGYILAIEEIIREGNGVCLFATHSSIVLQEIPHTNVKEIKYDFDRKRSVFLPVKIKTFGESVSYINDAIFGTHLRNTGFYTFVENSTETSLDDLKYFLGSEALLLKRIRESENVSDYPS
jgi:putative ABC-type multidrug transport system, ATPase component